MLLNIRIHIWYYQNPLNMYPEILRHFSSGSTRPACIKRSKLPDETWNRWNDSVSAHFLCQSKPWGRVITKFSSSLTCGLGKICSSKLTSWSGFCNRNSNRPTTQILQQKRILEVKPLASTNRKEEYSKPNISSSATREPNEEKWMLLSQMLYNKQTHS